MEIGTNFDENLAIHINFKCQITKFLDNDVDVLSIAYSFEVMVVECKFGTHVSYW